MKNKSLHNIKNTGFNTPDNYFESFDDKLLSKLDNIDHIEGVKTPGFKIPENYLDEFDQTILAKIDQPDSKVIAMIPWRKIASVTAVAASLFLMFTVVFNSASDEVSFDSIETATLENYLSEEDFTSLELAALFTEDELNSNDLVETNISDDSLEDYLLENTSIEDLIIE